MCNYVTNSDFLFQGLPCPLDFLKVKTALLKLSWNRLERVNGWGALDIPLHCKEPISRITIILFTKNIWFYQLNTNEVHYVYISQSLIIDLFKNIFIFRSKNKLILQLNFWFKICIIIEISIFSVVHSYHICSLFCHHNNWSVSVAPDKFGHWATIHYT